MGRVRPEIKRAVVIAPVQSVGRLLFIGSVRFVSFIRPGAFYRSGIFSDSIMLKLKEAGLILAY